MKVCRNPLYVSRSSRSGSSHSIPNIVELPALASLELRDRSAIFSNGQCITGFDIILCCTGFDYDYPFLNNHPATRPPRSPKVYQHIFSAQDPTLAFIGLIEKAVPWPVAEAQAIVISSVWSSKIRLPAQVDMTKWINEHYIAIDKPQLRYPHDIDYLNEMLRWAEEGEGNAGSGMNKTNFPVQWSEAKRWWRQQVPFARKAFRDLGELRFTIRSMEMLGFEFPIKSGTEAI